MELVSWSSEYFGFAANSHSTKYSIVIYYPGWYNGPMRGRSTKWTQVSPHPNKLKKNCCLLVCVFVGTTELLSAPDIKTPSYLLEAPVEAAPFICLYA
jgi:hypothetical protein